MSPFLRRSDSPAPTPDHCLPILFLLLGAATGGCAGSDVPAARSVPDDPATFVAWDSVQVLGDLEALAHDSMGGRRTGTQGGGMAQRYIHDRFVEAGLAAPPGGFLQPFEFTNRRDTTQVVQGANVVAVASGTNPELGTIVVTAHFDHLGIREPRETAAGEVADSIYNGADDNASGTAALLSLGRYLAHHPLRHPVVLAAVDAEEMGLRGSRHFVEAGWPETMVLNLNLDMLARTDSVLFAAGTYHYPELLPPLEVVAGGAPLSLRFGHDRPGVEGQQDWTRSSDHHPFHQEGIPFVYFGVEDHPDYHRPTDEFDRIDPGLFLDAVQTVLAALLALDQEPLAEAAPTSEVSR